MRMDEGGSKGGGGKARGLIKSIFTAKGGGKGQAVAGSDPVGRPLIQETDCFGKRESRTKWMWSFWMNQTGKWQIGTRHSRGRLDLKNDQITVLFGYMCGKNARVTKLGGRGDLLVGRGGGTGRREPL